ncbi:LPS export ABC transporter permease LptF [Sansalvadorimonas sp. 2012CJ34-2]|uniref:Lipopolysaccharide export system permease protein LptF n=1 Tax=Parendozoicomonas callyspongiae TaxID=2942213 RepID=A0ABT0PCE4_9GAMM|nr:LPS export ABC transporter permease LptF [Sansalvadorimonas sp. 2012CJ34-2]MCL6269052.1 LPS export ABC transporter permease LptF [Sansalvadorimonas sp. 2012CJ34-2]
MIVLRYLARELVQSWLAISGVLLLIIVSGRFIKYLQQAATGELKAEFLFAIMGYRLPGFLEIILPLGLFLSILLAYGRMYVDSEMVVLEACGMSRNRLLGYTFVPAFVIMIVVAVISCVLSPWGASHVERILNTQDAMTEFDTLTPGRFQSMNDGVRVTYTESLSSNKSRMEGVFIAEHRVGKEGEKGQVTLLLADGGRMYPDPESGKRYLLLENGYRYDLAAGQPESRLTQYDTYGIQMQDPEVRPVTKENALPTEQIFGSDQPRLVAEWQWRISLPLLIPVIVFMALPLARVNPRQGRFMKLLPGVLLYLVYLALLIASRGAVEDGKIPPEIGLWGVHAVFTVIALVMFFWPQIQNLFSGARSIESVDGGVKQG